MERTTPPNNDGLAMARQALAILDQVDISTLSPHAQASMRAQHLSLKAQLAGLQVQQDFIAQTTFLLTGVASATQMQTQFPECMHNRA